MCTCCLGIAVDACLLEAYWKSAGWSSPMWLLKSAWYSWYWCHCITIPDMEGIMWIIHRQTPQTLYIHMHSHILYIIHAYMHIRTGTRACIRVYQPQHHAMCLSDRTIIKHDKQQSTISNHYQPQLCKTTNANDQTLWANIHHKYMVTRMLVNDPIAASSRSRRPCRRAGPWFSFVHATCCTKSWKRGRIGMRWPCGMSPETTVVGQSQLQWVCLDV